MSLFKSLAVACTIAATSATPISPSRVRTAADEAQSAFPIGDACAHEWQSLHFNPDDETHKGRLQKLHDVICSGEMRAISSWGGKAATDKAEVFKLSFDLEEETPEKVNDVLKKIYGNDSNDGAIGEIVGTMIVDNNDFGNEDDGSCTVKGTQGYTLKDGGDGLEKIHFGDGVFDMPLAGNVDCGSLDKYPSEKMDTFSRVVLHEMLHYSTVGLQSQLGDQLVDQKKNDGNYAYGHARAHGLQDPGQDDQPGKSEINADNFAYMALSTWVGYFCLPEDKKDQYGTYFPDAPPH
ncbi:hypothetical protein VHEMI04882 [[Torrubiella] hemipterigena]|uniref:Lysine-specific metallo-endopeptidase domain-containing protein n=1 Tax=[Torrubiella] hemipterigena TaxID=1531966 RepID=A0A0A1SWG2_9HYPO|nr:hypothetical protein VHEMI04882 [[Torrubiella] hemipterigena]